MNTIQQINVVNSRMGLLQLAEQLDSASMAHKVERFSRYSFYRYKEFYFHGGEAALVEIGHEVPMSKNRVEPVIKKAVVEFGVERPACGQARASNARRERGHFIFRRGVRCVWQRHDLESFDKRLKALSAKIAQDGGIHIEDHLCALERAPQELQARSEVEAERPGYLGRRDTYYVANIRGMGSSTSRPSLTAGPKPQWSCSTTLRSP